MLFHVCGGVCSWQIFFFFNLQGAQSAPPIGWVFCEQVGPVGGWWVVGHHWWAQPVASFAILWESGTVFLSRHDKESDPRFFWSFEEENCPDNPILNSLFLSGLGSVWSVISVVLTADTVQWSSMSSMGSVHTAHTWYLSFFSTVTNFG